MKGRLPRNANIDLGLAILASTSEPPHTAQTIAAYCGCSRQCIQQIEQKALRKLRAALYRDRILSEAFENELQGLSKKSIT
jgi:DNA-directed RNA polymerase sigma subunit (sigma70/sigma32)